MPAGPEIPTCVIGTIPVSSLAPEDDHQLVIQAIREYSKHLYANVQETLSLESARKDGIGVIAIITPNRIS